MGWSPSKYPSLTQSIETSFIFSCSAEGNLWIALLGASSIVCVNNQGDLIKTVNFAAPNITCPAWGGSDYSELYITSSPPFHSGNIPEGDQGGHIFRYKPSIGGARKHEFAV
jgi:sugar lactone lactonase YvrE